MRVNVTNEITDVECAAYIECRYSMLDAAKRWQISQM